MKRIASLCLVALFGLTACDSLNPMGGETAFAPLQGSESAEGPQTLAYWHFNAAHTGNTIAANVGDGTLSYEFTAGVTSFTGTLLNVLEGVLAGNDFTVRASGSSLQNNGKSFTLAVPTTGHEAIVLTYATRRSNLGFTAQEVCYSTDGSTFPAENCESVTPISNTSSSNVWRVETVDFTGKEGVKDNEDFKIRVTLVDDGEILVLDDQGNNRFDNIKVEGTVATSVTPEPPAPAPWTIEGFFRPVDMTADKFNVVRAGSTVPLKFRVYDEEGVEVTDPAGITLTRTALGSCSGTNTNALPEEVALGGTGTIRYSDDQFVANWTTPRGQNFCYVVRAEAPNGASTEALFQSR